MIVKGIERQFTCTDDARKAGAGVGKRVAGAMSPTDKASLVHFIKNAPTSIKIEIEKGFKELFPEQIPCGANAMGGREEIDELLIAGLVDGGTNLIPVPPTFNFN